MYFYLDAPHDGDGRGSLTVIGAAPTSPGRLAKNHNKKHNKLGVSLNRFTTPIPNINDVSLTDMRREIAVGNVVNDNDLIDEVTPWMRSIMPQIAALLHNTLADSPVATKKKVIAAMEELAAIVDASPELFDVPGNVSHYAAVIATTSRLVDKIMRSRAFGWSVKGETAETAGNTGIGDYGTRPTHGYGLVGMSLGVVSEDTERAKEEAHGVFYPRVDETYIVDTQVSKLFEILEESSKYSPQNVNLIGPHGCGKTELAIQFAARNKRPLLIMDCANLREARDWFGYKSARDGTVFWHESQFVRAVQSGGHVILLDELNRANPNLLNTLMPILDARRFTYLEERGDKIVVGPGTVFFASMNEGAGYTGTSTLDRAIRDRFPRAVELTYLNEEAEIKLLMARTGIHKDIATRLVQLATKIRLDATGATASLTETLSTRQLLAASADFVIGGVDTLQFTVTNHFSPDGDEESERVKVQSIIQGKFGDMIAAQAAAAKKTGA